MTIKLKSIIIREVFIRVLLLLGLAYVQFQSPFVRIIQLEEWTLYKYPSKVSHALLINHLCIAVL